MLNYDISYYKTLLSTNTYLKEQAKQGAYEGKVVVADFQTEGKGSKGRSFYSPDGGLYFSVLLRPDFDKCLNLTPLAAVSVATAIENFGFDKVSIKWVNDIYLDGKKLCGILTEGGFDKNNSYYAIVGIGINLSMPELGFPSELKNSAASLYPSPIAEKEKLKILHSILNDFSLNYEKLDKKEYLSLYREKSYLIDKEVSISNGANTYSGKVIGISDNFELLIKTEQNQIIPFSSGDVQLKITCKK